MTLVNKITQVLGVRFYDTPSVYCIVFTTGSQVSFSHRLSPMVSSTSPYPPFPSCNHHTSICVYELSFFVLNLFTFFLALFLTTRTIHVVLGGLRHCFNKGKKDGTKWIQVPLRSQFDVVSLAGIPRRIMLKTWIQQSCSCTVCFQSQQLLDFLSLIWSSGSLKSRCGLASSN